MDNLKTLIEPIKAELENFRNQYKESLSGHSEDFQSMIDYISDSSGKHVRPILLLLSAELCGRINQRTIDYAVILELLHTATLIHDDVVDNTMERRGRLSVNARFDNRLAVLLGDYVLTVAIVKGIATKNQTVLELMGRLSQNLVEGELVQLISSKEHIIDEKRYFEVIHKKTALLLSSATEMGALSVDATQEDIRLLRSIGEYLGIIFQIKDDVFDYFEQGELGKPTGNDIREGKVTLPLIYALKNAPQQLSNSMYNLITEQDFTPETIKQLIDFAKEQGGIEYAESKMQEYKIKTLDLLKNYPGSSAKSSLLQLIDFIIDRKK